MAQKIGKLIASHKKWMAYHGETLEGYVAKWGKKDDPNRYGPGGEAWYERDIAELKRLEAIRDRSGDGQCD